MIYWTYSTFSQEDIDRFERDADKLLSEEEKRAYRKLTIPKRREEWLASRILAKCLVTKVFAERDLGMCEVEVHKEASGMPFIVLDGKRVGRLSLSHSGKAAVIAFSPDSNARVGVDIERLEERTTQMTDLFFTPHESRWVASFEGYQLALAQNLVWSAKESYLKAIGKGLHLDTRKVAIGNVDLVNSNSGIWHDIAFSTDSQDEMQYAMVFQARRNYVLTLCADRQRKLEFVPLELAQVEMSKESPSLCLACKA